MDSSVGNLLDVLEIEKGMKAAFESAIESLRYARSQTLVVELGESGLYIKTDPDRDEVGRISWESFFEHEVGPGAIWTDDPEFLRPEAKVICAKLRALADKIDELTCPPSHT